jgi:hypothetical protein
MRWRRKEWRPPTPYLLLQESWDLTHCGPRSSAKPLTTSHLSNQSCAANVDSMSFTGLAHQSGRFPQLAHPSNGIP